MSSPRLDVFMGYGIELEYAIVDRASLDCRPIADLLMQRQTGEITGEVHRGMLGWSNELVMHVLEIKNQRPTVLLDHLPEPFQGEVNHINRLLREWNAQLMPGAMHPWMNPHRETRIWPHDHADIYRAYERIFDTRTHGWANLQSMHVNLPFNGDRQFCRLHAAIRLVLPIIPALAASSPLANGEDTGYADFRMEAYRGNAPTFPSIAGRVIPDCVPGRAQYEEKILQPMYDAIAPHDPEGTLHNEWLNSRGAIARFDRNAIEIRVIDTQECPKADLSVAAAVIAAVKSLYHAHAAPLSAQQSCDTDALTGIFHACIRDAEKAVISDRGYLGLLGFPGDHCTAGRLWRHLIESMSGDQALHPPVWREHLDIILEQGTLARRILRALDGDFSRARIGQIYRQLCDCLAEGKSFVPGAADA